MNYIDIKELQKHFCAQEIQKQFFGGNVLSEHASGAVRKPFKLFQTFLFVKIFDSCKLPFLKGFDASTGSWNFFHGVSLPNIVYKLYLNRCIAR